jgi:hypothetical protein
VTELWVDIGERMFEKGSKLFLACKEFGSSVGIKGSG